MDIQYIYTKYISFYSINKERKKFFFSCLQIISASLRTKKRLARQSWKIYIQICASKFTKLSLLKKNFFFTRSSSLKNYLNYPPSINFGVGLMYAVFISCII